MLLSQSRTFIQNLRPKKMKRKKAFRGYYKTRLGGSLRGTTVRYGDFGLQALEGGRLSDKQLDNARTALRRVIKSEKGAKFYLRVFTDRPVTAKGAEARMGKGKGAVEYFATWVSGKRVLFEVKGVRKETAQRAMQVAAAVLPIRTRFVVADESLRVAPRVDPYFMRRKAFEEAKMERLRSLDLKAEEVLKKAALGSI
ncbi:hypothetical protein HK098_002750 [Nowakowskiella sp. JEL0407]|nr:hypothetical protein HK098_002750 [Nowakowskiella sp. JEL0407]